MSYQTLKCPECGMQNSLSLQVVATRGRTLDPDVICAGCGADLYLHHTRLSPEDPPDWQLLSAERYALEVGAPAPVPPKRAAVETGALRR